MRWSIVLGYSLLALGVPLPLGAARSTGEPYPCMDHQCGCGSAEQCWRHCCCMSMVEKLTWARDHKIDPPLYVILEARQQGIDWIAFCAGGALKQTEQCTACCAHCGHESSAAARPQQNSPNSKLDGRRPQSVVFSAMLKCHGAAQSWLSLGNYVPPPASNCIGGQNLFLELLGIYSDRADSISFRPALRPPRSLIV